MKSVIWSVACVVLLYGAGSASASPAVPQAAAATSDSALDKKIEARLKANASLKRYNIDTSVDGGVVTLTGTVATEAQKARAGQLAMTTGVTRVDNQIVVDPQTRGTGGTLEKTKEGAKKVGEATKEGAKTAAEKTKEGAKTAAEKTKEGAVKVGDEVSDAWIITRVKSKFVGEDVLKGSDINVDCDNQVVTLKGTVPTEAARARAIQQAKEVEHVKRVVDNLTIGPKK